MPQDAVVGHALEVQDLSLAKKPVHRVEVIASRMALFEQYHLALAPGFDAVLDHYTRKGPKVTQRAGYPAWEIDSCARELKTNVSVEKVYTFLSLFTLGELCDIGV